MRTITFLAAALLVACPKSEAPKESKKVTTETRPVSKTQPKPNSGGQAADPFEAVWTKVEGSKSGCDDFDYFPDGGMRNMSCHLKTILPYGLLQELAPTAIWRDGPHGKAGLVLDSEKAFGRYDPKFVVWLSSKAIPAATNPAFKSKTAVVYERFFSKLARVYHRAAVQLDRNPEFLAAEKAYLIQYADNPEGKRPLDRLGRHEPEDMYNLYAPALAFWIRRHADGTAGHWRNGLDKLIETYDVMALEAYEDVDLTIPPAPGEAKPSAAAVEDGPLEQMVAQAWKLLPDAKFGCGDDQFEYDPGGMRVVYCYVLPILNLRTVKAKMPIFRDGPHGGSFDFDQERSFGHYDPRFVRWLVDHGIPGAKDDALRAKTQPFYDRRLRIPVRAFYAAHLKLASDPNFAATEKRKYERYVSGDGQPPYWSYWEMFPGVYEAQAIAGTGVAFWLRRAIDGTDAMFKEAIEKLLRTYDKKFFDEAKKVGFDGLKARPDLFGEENP